MANELELRGVVDRIMESAGAFTADLLKWAAMALIALVVLYILYKLLKRKRVRPEAESEPGIDVTTLGEGGPPPGGPVLEFHNIPVRLAAVVLAPAGRVRSIPPPAQLADTYEDLLPGLSKVVESHRPALRIWPPQVSSRGFALKVFQHCQLPGDGGKGSTWCAAAGAFKSEGQPVMAGLIMRTPRPTSHGQQIIDDPDGGWIGSLKVKDTA